MQLKSKQIAFLIGAPYAINQLKRLKWGKSEDLPLKKKKKH
jgi:hypothetical protein